MGSKSLTPEQMEARTARFKNLKTYQTQNFEAHNIPPGAVEKVTARKVFPVMAPADYQGRSAGAPVKGPRGLIVSIAECEPNNGPGLHRHLNTVENFFCLSGRFEISWGDEGEHKLVLEPNDMISVPRGENRKFFNISERGRPAAGDDRAGNRPADRSDQLRAEPRPRDRERIRQAGARGPADDRLQVRGAGGLNRLAG